MQHRESMPPVNERLDDAVARYHADRQPRWTSTIQTMAAGAATLAIYGATWLGTDITHGIREGKSTVEHSHSKIHTIALAAPELSPIYQQHATYVLTGLGTKDPSGTAARLTAHQEMGSVFGIEYSNQDLNIREMAEQVISTTRHARLKTISLDGYSAGGLVGLAVAAYIRTHAPDIYVASVVLNSTPVGTGSLSEQSARGIDVMDRILSINEDLKYYTDGRVAVEVYNRRHNYLKEQGTVEQTGFALRDTNTFTYNGTTYHLDYAALRREITDVETKMQRPDVASASLIDSQAHFIVNANYDRYIAELDPETTLIYTGSLNARDDTVVAIEPSIHNLEHSAAAHHKRLIVFRAQVGHANPAERTSQYNSMLHDQIRPVVTQRLTLRFLGDELEQQSIPLVQAFGTTPQPR